MIESVTRTAEGTEVVYEMDVLAYIDQHDLQVSRTSGAWQVKRHGIASDWQPTLGEAVNEYIQRVVDMADVLLAVIPEDVYRALGL